MSTSSATIFLAASQSAAHLVRGLRVLARGLFVDLEGRSQVSVAPAKNHILQLQSLHFVLQNDGIVDRRCHGSPQSSNLVVQCCIVAVVMLVAGSLLVGVFFGVVLRDKGWDLVSLDSLWAGDLVRVLVIVRTAFGFGVRQSRRVGDGLIVLLAKA